MRNITAALTAAVLAAGALPAQAKIGLSSQFINVAIENLKPGRTYNLRELKGIPYTVKNRGTGPVDILVETMIPPAKDVRAPYEPILDPSWVQISPNRLKLAAGEPGFSDLIISVPDDPKLVGRHFHAVIWAHTVETGLLAAGVKSDIRFSVGKGPDTLAEEERRAAMVELNYDLWPTALTLSPTAAGPYDAKKAEKKSFKLTNRSEKELKLVFRAIPWQTGLVPLPQGYETLSDLSWVKFDPQEVSVEGESLKEIKLTLDVPAALAGKKLAVLVQEQLPIGTIVGATHRLYLHLDGVPVQEEKKP